MSKELKPCPFCGGEALMEAIDFDDYDYTKPSEVIWWVRCSVCGAETDEYSGLDEAEAAAIKAWNGRAERTCHIVATWKDSDFVNDWNYKCSECGCFIPVDERDIKTGEVFRAANYCPTCGAKVVKEGEV